MVRKGSPALLLLGAGALAACSLALPFSGLDQDWAAASAGTDASDGLDADRAALVDGGAALDAACLPGSALLMTDPNNCGACGHVCCGSVCEDGGCIGGNPSVLAANVSSPGAVTLDPDGTGVYWAEYVEDAGTAIVRYDNASKKTTMTFPGMGVTAMTIDENALYVVDSRSGLVASVPRDGGASSTLAKGESSPAGLTLAEGRLWWTDQGGGSNGAVRVANIDGTDPQTLYAGQPGPTGIAVFGGTVVWTQFTAGHEVTVGGTDGGASTPYTDNDEDQDPYSVVTDGTSAFWGDVSRGQVSSFTPGGTPQVIASTPSSGIGGVAVDENYVYWLTVGNGATLYATPRNGGSGKQLLVGNLACPTDIAVDDRCIYWVNSGVCTSWWSGAAAGTGSVARIEKPAPPANDP